MERDAIEEQKRTSINLINHYTNYLKELESMTPDEDKPVEYSCYTVVFNEWKVCVDQRLTTSELEAVKSCQKHYWIVELNRILVFTSVTSQCIDNTLNNILIVQDSKPF